MNTPITWNATDSIDTVDPKMKITLLDYLDLRDGIEFRHYKSRLESDPDFRAQEKAKFENAMMALGEALQPAIDDFAARLEHIGRIVQELNYD
jgi:hypothetical protein